MADANQEEMKPGSPSCYVSFNRLREGVDYMFTRFDTAERYPNNDELCTKCDGFAFNDSFN